MANRFDQPAQAQFINTYVPIPFEELAQAAQMRQGKHEQGLQALDAAEAAAMDIKAIPTNPNQVKQRDELIKRVDDIVGRYSKEDLSDEEVYRSLRLDMRKALPKDVISNLESNYNMWERAQEDKRRLAVAGLYNPALDDDPAMDETWGAAGEAYEYVPRMYQPKEEALKNYMSGLQQLTSKGYDPATGILRHGRDAGDLEAVIGQYASQYADTPSGRDEIRLFKQSNPEQAAQMNDIEIASQVMRDYGQQFLRNEDRIITGGRGRGTGSPFAPSQRGLSQELGAEITNESARKIKRRVEEQEKELAKRAERGENVSYERAQLEEQKSVIQEAEKLSETFYDNQTAPIKDASKNTISSFDFISGPAEKQVLSVFDKHIEKNKDEHLSLKHGTLGGVRTEYPGIESLKDELKDLGLKRREIDRVTDVYENYFAERNDIRKEADAQRTDFIRENINTQVQQRVSFSPAYYQEDGILQYKTADGEDHTSQFAMIADKASLNPDRFKLDFSDETGRPIVQRKLTDKMKKGELAINPSKSDFQWELGGEGDKDIIVKTGLFTTDKDGNATSNKEADMSFHVSDPTLKDAVVEELLYTGNEQAAYYLTPFSWSIQERVRQADIDEQGVHTIDLEGDYRAMVTNDNNTYTVTFFDPYGDPMINPSTGEPETYTRSHIGSVKNLINGKAFSIHQGGVFGYRWTDAGM